MKTKQLKELLLQSLEHELGGVKVYEMAIQCARNKDLKEEWEGYLAETEKHVQALLQAFSALKLDPKEQSPGRAIVRKLGASLLAAMKEARETGTPQAAQLVACECVVIAETKDHHDWHLIGEAAKKMKGPKGKALKEAHEEVEDEEDEHLYHSKGWCRELWLESLGLKAVLPPPEEKKHVKTAIGAARAEQARTSMR